MYYKIAIDDDSFIIADENYKLTLFYLAIVKKVVTVKEYLADPNLKKYHLKDVTRGSQVYRDFTISTIEDLNGLQVGVRYKKAKDIQPGDLLIGPDGSPRTVEELHRGTEEMYEIEVDGVKHVVNGNHILYVVNTNSSVDLEIPVKDYMKLDDEYKSQLRLVQVKEG